MTSEPLPEDPNEAERLLEATIADAEKNPVESTTGQFGPWSQEAQVARIRMQYAMVAALYRKAGNDDEANRKMEIAEEAVKTVAGEDAFAAMMALGQLQRTQIALDDVDGLIRAAAAVQPELWLMSADAIVAKVLSSGNVDEAKKLAKQALSTGPAFNAPQTNQSAVISCFIEAGEIQAAHELVKTSKPIELTAVACEIAGRAMIKSNRGQLLRTSKWRNDIGPFQRAHLSIGALMAKQNLAK